MDFALQVYFFYLISSHFFYFFAFATLNISRIVIDSCILKDVIMVQCPNTGHIDTIWKHTNKHTKTLAYIVKISKTKIDEKFVLSS